MGGDAMTVHPWQIPAEQVEDCAKACADKGIPRHDDAIRIIIAAAQNHKPANSPTSLETLRELVTASPGEWTRASAVAALRGPLGVEISRERGRQLLNQLADEGLLDKQGPQGKLWTRTERPAAAPHVLAGYEAVRDVIHGAPGTAERDSVIWAAVQAFRAVEYAERHRQHEQDERDDDGDEQ
jgi:hypothetical protein